jgi:arylsulfatase A-like enzyme
MSLRARLSCLCLLPVCVLIALFSTDARTFAGEGRKLNVLFIISDDLRPELGCYGSKMAVSTNIDALAAAGLRFDRAYCQFPLCNPSRSSMLNGRHPTSTGILGNRGFFRDEHPDFISLPQLFKTNGYETLRTGKIFHDGIDDTDAWTDGGEPRGPNAQRSAFDLPPLGDKVFAQYRQPNNRPGPADAQMTQAQRSDRWLILDGDGEGHPENAVADRAIAYLRKYGEKPFFLAVGFSKPHSPPTAPQRFYDMHPLDTITLPPNFAPRPTVPEGFPSRSIRPRNADLFVDRDATPETAKDMIRAYMASVSWMDWNLGRVIAELDRLKLRENTVIVFWGDHGYQLGERGKWSKAGSLFEQGTRTPLIFVAPGVTGKGRVSPRIVEAVDIYPTLAELCGIQIPRGVEGHSLVPLLKNPDAAWNRPAYSLWSENGLTYLGAVVRTERWRFAEFEAGRGGAMLFDEQADPDELKNLANDPKYADVCADLAPLVRKYLSGEIPR